MTLIFWGSMCTPSLSMMYPQKNTRLWKNVKFMDAGKELVLRSSSCTKSRCRWCSSASFEEDVVLVHPYKYSQVVWKDIIHDALERRWCITEAEGHNNPLEGAKLCVEGGFLDIFVLDSDLVEPTNKVYLRKYSGTPQCTQEGLDRWQRILISYSSRTQRSVVDAHAPFTIRFLYQ